MKTAKDIREIEELKNKLMKRLGALDPKAIEVIDELKKKGIETKDDDLVGYAYYRYAYYYYFTAQDLTKFRKAVFDAIKYLLRSGDKEYLGGAYNLIAYDAMDLGSYDVAYAYYMMAVKTAEQKDGIALPGMVEASAGRLLIELGDYEKGQNQQKNAIKRMEEFTDMHVFNYNMILTFADIALASFIKNDLPGVKEAKENIRIYYDRSSKEEINLSKTYFLLTNLFESLLEKDDERIEEDFALLLKHWKRFNWSELFGLIFEIESLCDYMLDNDYINHAGRLLDAASPPLKDENLAISLRYYSLKAKFYEKVHDFTKLKECLSEQYKIKKDQVADMVKTLRYAMEFSDMIAGIAKEREKAQEANVNLQIKANTDALTGLPNRNAMNNYLQQKFDEAERDGTLFGIGIIDIDNFKQFNDLHGHKVGDECLKCIGKALIKFNDNPKIFCSRYGGDEFVVGYFGLTGREINKIKKEMEREIALEGERFIQGTIKISQGSFAAVPDGKRKMWDYLTVADKKLYAIKDGGKKGRNK